MQYLCEARVDLGAITYNYREIKNHVGPNVRIMGVVKANAYGHGATVVAHHLSGLGIRDFAVAHCFEAQKLREAGIVGRILVLQPDFHVDHESYQRFKFDCSINGLRDIDAWRDTQGPRVRAHIFVDTGMGREGVMPELFEECLRRIEDHPVLELAGVATHLASADEEDLDYAREQLAIFNGILDLIPQKVRQKIVVHALNSAGTVNFPEAHFDMVRPGIWLYGQYTGSGSYTQQAALSVYGRLSCVKIVPAGYKVGYASNYETKERTRLGLVSVGYADGLNRKKSGSAQVHIRGKAYEVAGNISMDAVVIDIGLDSDVREGDEVMVFGGNQGDEFSIANCAKELKTITYERCCHLGMRLPHVYIDSTLD